MWPAWAPRPFGPDNGPPATYGSVAWPRLFSGRQPGRHEWPRWRLDRAGRQRLRSPPAACSCSLKRIAGAIRNEVTSPSRPRTWSSAKRVPRTCDSGTVDNVSSTEWTTVTLDRAYRSMVVVVTPTTLPGVLRSWLASATRPARVSRSSYNAPMFHDPRHGHPPALHRGGRRGL